MGEKDLLPLQRDTLTDRVISQIQQMILSGQVAPGGWLPSQYKLAEGFDVGMSTVREAIRSLALMGILNPQVGRGTQVSPDALALLRMINLVRHKLCELNARKVHEARRLIEAGMTALAARRATERDMAQMEAALLKMAQSLDDDEAYIQADLAFHSAVAQAAKNDVAGEFYHILIETLSDAIRQVVQVPGVKQRGWETQHEILEAIRSHDVETARQLANDNLVEWDRILAVPQ